LLRVLHLHSSFSAGGKELRCAQLINAFGPCGIAHSIVSAEPEALGAAKAIDPKCSVDYPRDFPSLTGRPLPGRLQQLARAMAEYDLVLTYNWGAMDAVMAHTLFAQAYRLPPLVHHEDGFNQDEAVRLKRGRNWYRRVALGRASALVVPSERLERIALETWQQPRGRVRRIANGIATARYGRKPKPDVLPRVIKRQDELWLGTIAGLRAVKNLPRLVRAFATMPEPWQLVILGEGPERDAIRDEALRQDVGHRVHLAGFVADPAAAIGLFDLFALSSDSEQFPISVVEAMAAGLAVAAPAVGDVRAMVAPANAPLIAPPGDETALGEALLLLGEDAGLRRALGAANQQRARAEYDEAKMISAYRQVYAEALGRPQFP
jgi:glycosyltransferase involved in cell wall biosynthesis